MNREFKSLQEDGHPLLLAYQSRWTNETAKLAVCEKAAKIGMSWADAYASVLHAAGGSGNVYYQSYDKEVTQGYIQDCVEWIQRFQTIMSDNDGSVISNHRKQISRYRITMDSGKSIQCISSKPSALPKGDPCDRYILDVAAHCDNLEALLKGAKAWDGTVRIISTHKGVDNPFNRLVNEIKENKNKDYALHKITLDDAIADGLARRIYSVTGRDWHDAAADEWRSETYNMHINKEDADEELSCIPKK